MTERKPLLVMKPDRITYEPFRAEGVPDIPVSEMKPLDHFAETYDVTLMFLSADHIRTLQELAAEAGTTPDAWLLAALNHYANIQRPPEGAD